ncbi:MAG TPA: NAD(P)/FAD-dependent oxidoreductase [Solirubrobacteraceae bacterium]|nr:NAD(P)/FAD-dependent oxidoreductase [Solirubrobacteraceae bacterium]
MPVRATKRGDARTPLHGEWDVLVCGASFAGLTVARELARTSARVLIVDRYEIGERQTSACAAPTEWLEHLGLMGAVQQTFSDLLIHVPGRSMRWKLPWTFSTFDYRRICALLREQSEGAAQFETAKVEGRTGFTVHTDRGDLSAPLIVDGLGWRRILGAGANVQPPDARLSRGLEIHPHAAGDDLELWIDPKYVRRGYSWSFPADGELRVGVGSFDPRDHVKEPTLQLAADVGVPAERWQGNWIPHELRPGVEDGIFFVGDSAGHCLPTTAEGIRPAFYFGLALGRELRDVVEGRQTRAQALARYGSFTAEHEWQYRWLLRVQHLVGRVTPTRLLTPGLRLLDSQRFVDWSFRSYLDICPPDFALEPGDGHSLWRVPRPAVAA